jgi:hypothetical protein
MRLVRATAAILAWLVAALAVVLAVTGPGGPLPLSRVAFEQPTLTITGSIEDLEPGRPASLVLTVTSTASYGVVVHALGARVTAAAPAGCPVSALQVRPWRGSLPVPAHGRAQAPLAIRLAADATACRGATWQLAYSSS